MTVLVLVRHGLTGVTGTRLTGWQAGFPLSDSGRGQADALADRLAPLPVQAIYASPLERCRQTAEPLARRLRLSIRVRPQLGEVRFGRWTGRSLAQLRRTRLWRLVQLTPSIVRFPDGESFLEVQQRAVVELLRIADSHPDGLVVIVSHADVIKLVLAHFAGMHQDAFQRLAIDPCSASVIALGGGPPRIVKVNDTGDLGHLVPPSRRRSARRGQRPPSGPSARRVRG